MIISEEEAFGIIKEAIQEKLDDLCDKLETKQDTKTKRLGQNVVKLAYDNLGKEALESDIMAKSLSKAKKCLMKKETLELDNCNCKLKYLGKGKYSLSKN